MLKRAFFSLFWSVPISALLCVALFGIGEVATDIGVTSRATHMILRLVYPLAVLAPKAVSDFGLLTIIAFLFQLPLYVGFVLSTSTQKSRYLALGGCAALHVVLVLLSLRAMDV